MTTKIHGLRWYILLLVALGGVVNYVDRNVLAVLAPELEKVLHFSTQQYSYIVVAFLLFYSLTQPVAGYIIDRIGLRLGYFVFALLWGVSAVLHAFAGSWQIMAAFRGLLGVAASANIPSTVKTAALWFPAKERSVATGWANIGSSIGAMVTPPLVVWLSLTWGWQYAFVVTGLAAVVVALLWMLLYRNPERHPRLSEDERRYITADQAPVSQRPSIRDVLIKREFWGMAAARFLTEPAWQTFSFWIPLYMVTQRGMDIKQFALFGWLPFLAADLGSVVGGYLSPYLHGKLHISLVNSRIAGVGLGAFCMIGPAFVGLVSGPVVAILLFSLGGFAHQMLSSLLYALVTDKFEKQDVATATGFTGMAGYLGATLFTLTIGQLVGTIGYEPIFVCLSIFDLTAFAIVWFTLADRRVGPTALHPLPLPIGPAILKA
jgi:ACS family hexuronate transporter-like MFS transporter